MSHLGSACWCSIIIFDHSIMKLGGHSNNHMIEVRIVISTFWDIKTEGWVIVITSQKVIWIINKTWLMSGNFCEFRWPDTIVCILSLMNSEVRSPDSILNNSLSVIPFLEIISFIFLMSGVDLR